MHPGQFARVLDNLLTNACKFTPRGGSIAVALRQEAGRTLLTVEDTGQGLFTTRQIVQRHGNRVWVDSTEGQGTTFFVELP